MDADLRRGSIFQGVDIAQRRANCTKRLVSILVIANTDAGLHNSTLIGIDNHPADEFLVRNGDFLAVFTKQ